MSYQRFHRNFYAEGQGLSHYANLWDWSRQKNENTSRAPMHTHLPSLQFGLLQNRAASLLWWQFLFVPQHGDGKIFISEIKPDAHKQTRQNIRGEEQTKSPPKKWVQMSLGSYGRSAKQHLFLLALPLTTGAINGQLDGASGLFVPGIGWVNCCRVLNTKSTDINKRSMTTLSVFPDKST